MDIPWAVEVLKFAKLSDEEEAEHCRTLVESKMNECTLEVARILMKTFSEYEDYGVQECVVSVLASAERHDYLQALLEELPRLLVEAVDWAFVLVGREVLYHTESLIQVASEMEIAIRQVLVSLLNNEEFSDFYEQAEFVAMQINIGNT